MPRIEIWKSKALWHALSPEKKRQVIQSLRDSLNVSKQKPLNDEEPYWISKDGTDLLVWTSKLGLDDLPRFSTIDFPEYFELLSFMSPTANMNAKKIAQKLSK